MKVFRRIPSGVRISRPVVAAIGIFDGIHRGHQAILEKAVRRARTLRGGAAAVTFYPHPLTVLNPKLVPDLLLSLEERLEIFATLGIRLAVVIPFTRSFSGWSPEKFVERVLVQGLRVREVVVGHDFGFGKGRRGTVKTLEELGRSAGFKTHVVSPVRIRRERISSRRIRELICRGNLAQAQRFLGRPVTVTGQVVRGANRGRQLGFPTANLKLKGVVLPPVGVYAVGVRLDGRQRPGMANLGFRPTFQRVKGEGSKVKEIQPPHHPILEVHLFDLKRALYGQLLRVTFVTRIRSERRFASPEALREQLVKDAHRAQAVLRPGATVYSRRKWCGFR